MVLQFVTFARREVVLVIVNDVCLRFTFYLFYVDIYQCTVMPWSAGSLGSLFAGWAETRKGTEGFPQYTDKKNFSF